jgi:hypothetical protein
MGQKWEDQVQFPLRKGAAVVVLDDEEARTLEWVEIAGLIEISDDGSWRPTSYGWQQMAKLRQREATGTGRFH